MEGVDSQSKIANNTDFGLFHYKYQTEVIKSGMINVFKVTNEKANKISNQKVGKISQNMFLNFT